MKNNTSSNEFQKKINLKTKTTNELNNLCDEIRTKIINLSKKKSIHLASNLGIVELSLSLLYCFDSPKDKIVYDTGHQSYVHKILTSRWNSFESIRDDDGISGFQDHLESEHDFVSSGHSGSILSFCQGAIEANKNTDSKNFFITVIGDASLSTGLSFEALNNIAFNKTKMIIVVNDNEMSISKNVGQLYKIMSKLKISKSFFLGEKIFKRTSTMNKYFHKMFGVLFKFYNFCENILVSKNFFQNLGFQYIGPIDGHNIKELIKAFEKAKWYSKRGTILVHVKTSKGKGYKTNDIEELHSPSPNIVNDIKLLSYSNIAANWLYEKSLDNSDIFVFNCGMTLSTGFKTFSKKFNKQYEDLGISEEHAVTKSGGMMFDSNKRVYLIIYSTFLQRAYDEIHHDVARLNLPVTFLVDRADISYGDGDTHHGIYDLSFLKTIPNAIICSPSNNIELNELLRHSLENKQYPFFIRYSKNTCPIIDKVENINFGEWKFIIQNRESTNLIISYGNTINEIQKLIKNKNIDLLNAIYLTHFSKKFIISIFKKYKNIYVIEKVYFQNNLYSELIQIAFEKNFFSLNIKNYCITTNKIGFGSIEKIDKKVNIYIPDIIDSILKKI